MYLTILTGQVAPQNQSNLEQAYDKIYRHPPDGLLESYLIRSTDRPGLWQIISVWRTQNAYEEAHQARQTELCVQMFCDAGVIPERIGYEVVEKYQRV